MVYYRKYRPQTLSDLIGQENIKVSLLSALNSQKLSHAYLFCGPRGTGKTSTARILAKMVNCTTGKNKSGTNDSIPCNTCESCLSITDGSNMDLIEIDAASNRGIEDIRSLRENIKLSPTSSLKKVYIIDEVHMLTNEAFNALLKTLEEPPAHALFILATTDPQKIPATILSRVTRLDFKLATIEDLKIALKKICDSEKLVLDDEVLSLICKKAQGSFRDGIKLLDQLSSLEKIDLEQVEKALASSSNKEILDLLSSVAQKNTQASIETLLNVLSTGASIKELTLSLLDSLRMLLFIKNNLGERLVLKEIGDEKYADLKALADKFSVESIIKTIDGLTSSLDKGRYSSIGSLPLEIAIVESCLEENKTPVLVSVQQNTSLPVFSSQLSEQSQTKSQVLSESPEENQKSVERVLTDDVVIPMATLTTPGTSIDMQKIAEKWNYILETAKSFNFSLEALLRSSKIAKVEEKTVFIEVPYSFHQRMIEAPKSRELLETVLTDVVGRNIEIKTVLGQRPKRSDDMANLADVAADDEIVRIASEIFAS